DELVRPGTGAGAHQVIVSNIYSVAALARGAGAEVIDLGILPDRMDATQTGVRAALDGGFDVLVTTGGASVGDHDLIAPALTAQGVDLAVHKIALRPGKPLMFGCSAATRTQVLGLPGNPVSAHVCALLFLVPLIKALQGLAVPAHPELEPARLAADVKANEQRMDFQRAEIVGHAEGVPLVRPLPVQDSSMLRNLARADVLLVRRPHAPATLAGEACEILRLED
ncbi:MAG: molybdopterin molybdenumtransferase MoeA, partial [Starkeya sp.]|nr:molybdopterin molybdenumtransferase MoeA [Starkeya sp.]